MTPPDVCIAVVDHILENPSTPMNPQIAAIFGNCTFFLVHSYACADPESNDCKTLEYRLREAQERAQKAAEDARLQKMIQKGRAL